jgi:hypothetical protein
MLTLKTYFKKQMMTLLRKDAEIRIYFKKLVNLLLIPIYFKKMKTTHHKLCYTNYLINQLFTSQAQRNRTSPFRNIECNHCPKME